MSSMKWIQSAVISVSLLLSACGGGGGDSDGDNTPNSAPTAAITSPADGSVHPENSDIAFTGTGSDSEDGTLSGAALEWSSNTDGQLGTGATVSATPSTGTHIISLKVTDSDGATETATITVTVNAAPVIGNVEVSPSSVNTGTPVTFSWSITDADSDTLSCSLDVDADGTDDYTVDDCANNTSQAHTYAQAGNYSVRLTVTDGVNAAVQQNVSVTVTDAVTGNASPQVDSFDATPAAPKTGDSVTFGWNLSDADGDTLTCKLDIDGDGTDDYTLDDCANTTSQAHTYTVAGDYQARLTVSDGINAPVQQSVSVNVTVTGNASPQVDSFDAAPDAPKTGDSVTFSWNLSDADGDTLTCKLDIDGDGTDNYTIDDCANNTSQAHTYTQAGDYQVRLTVADGMSASVQETVSLTVSAATTTSTSPVINQFTAGSNPAYSTVASTFYWQISDPDGDTLTCKLDVDGDGTDDYTVNDCANSASQAHAYASTGDYTVRLMVSDGVNDVQATLALVVKPHLLLDVTVDGPVSAQGRALYTITVSNVSAVPIEDVSVVYTVPAELQFHAGVDAEPDTNCGSACGDGQEAAWALRTLAAGESRTITINATVLDDILAGALISVPVRVTSTDAKITDDISVTKTVVVHKNPAAELAMSASKDPVMPGENLRYQFDISNIDAIDAQMLADLSLRVTLPAGVTVEETISDDGTLDATTGEIVWEMDSLAVGNAIQREVTVTVNTDAVAGQILAARAELRHAGGVALDASVEHAVTVVAGTFPLTLDISATPDPAVANGRLLYELTVSNISTGPVDAVDVQFRVPPELRFHAVVDAEPNTNCGSACIDGEEASWALGTLAAGESRTITVNATVLDDILAGTLVSVPVRVTSTDAKIIDDISVSKTVVVHKNPVAELAMSASKDPVMPGESLGYQFDISNIDAIDAQMLTDLSLRVSLPAGVVVETISDGGIQDATTGEIVWEMDSLAVGNAIQYEVTVTVGTDAIAGQILAARAELRHAGGVDLDASAEHAVTVVTGTFPLTLVISATPDPAVASGRLLYELTVSNISTGPVDAVDVQFRVPPELRFHAVVDAEPNTNCGSACIDGEEASWALGTLAAGEGRTITVNATVLDDILAGTLVSVPVRVTSTDAKIIDDISVTKTVVVHKNPAAELAMSASKDPVMPGESLSFQFNIGNIDTTALANLELRAALPVGVTVETISDGGMQDATTGEIVWEMDSLAVDNAIQREVTVTVSTDAVAGQILAARAELRHAGGVDLDASAEHAVTVVTGTFPLTLDISATPDPVVADGRLSYELTVSNISTGPIDAVDVQFRVPPELRFHAVVDAEPNTNCGSPCIGGEEAVWGLGTLAAGESRTITVNATVLDDILAGALISVPVRVTSPDAIDNVNRITTTPVGN